MTSVQGYQTDESRVVLANTAPEAQESDLSESTAGQAAFGSLLQQLGGSIGHDAHADRQMLDQVGLTPRESKVSSDPTRALTDPVGLQAQQQLNGQIEAEAAAVASAAVANESTPAKQRSGSDRAGSERQATAGERTEGAASPAQRGVKHEQAPVQPASQIETKPASNKPHTEPAPNQTGRVSEQHASSLDSRHAGSTEKTAAEVSSQAPNRAGRIDSTSSAGGRETSSAALIGRLERASMGQRPMRVATQTADQQAGPRARFAVETPEAMRQTVKGLAQVLSSDGGSLTLRLTPEALGRVNVDVSLRDGVASAIFEASTEQAAKMLRDGEQELRAALEARGVRVQHLEVRSPDRHSEHQASDHRSSEQKASSTGPRFAENTEPEDPGSRPSGHDGGDGRSGGDPHASKDHAVARASEHAGVSELADAEEPHIEGEADGRSPSDERGAGQLRLDAVA